MFLSKRVIILNFQFEVVMTISIVSRISTTLTTFLFTQNNNYYIIYLNVFRWLSTECFINTCKVYKKQADILKWFRKLWFVNHISEYLKYKHSQIYWFFKLTTKNNCLKTLYISMFVHVRFAKIHICFMNKKVLNTIVAFACFQNFLVVLIQCVYYFQGFGVTYFYSVDVNVPVSNTFRFLFFVFIGLSVFIRGNLLFSNNWDYKS